MEAGILALQILVILAAGRCSMRIASCFLALFLLLRFSVLQQVSNLLCKALCKLGKVFERLQKRLTAPPQCGIRRLCISQFVLAVDVLLFVERNILVQFVDFLAACDALFANAVNCL